MQSSIGELRVQYRGIGSGGTALAPVVSDIITNDVAAELEVCLAHALAHDYGVYVVRRMRCDMIIGRRPRGEIAQRIAGRIVTSVMATIAGHDGQNVIRFDSEAEFIAAFVLDLLRGSAWDRWHYGAFRPLEAVPVADALKTVLREYHDAIPAVLARLHSAGALDDLLACVDGLTLRSLCDRSPDSLVSPGMWRPLFAAAVRLLETLVPSRTTAEYESAFDRWCARAGPSPDWRDEGRLTSEVESILRFLLTDIGAVPRLDAAALQRALDGLDWLATPSLHDAVTHIVGDATHTASDGIAILERIGLLVLTPTGRDTLVATVAAAGRTTLADIVRAAIAGGVLDRRTHPPMTAERLRAHGIASDADIAALLAALADDEALVAQREPPLTPLQRDLLADLMQVIREERLQFSPNDVAGNAIRLYAALMHARPRWASHESLVTATIERVTGTARELSALDSNLANELRRHTAADHRDASIATECAGVFLLMRAVLDARLAYLAQEHHYPTPDRSFAWLFPAIAVHWAGAFDHALAMIDDNTPTFEELRAVWNATPREAHVRFQAGLLRMLTGLRFINGGEMHVQKMRDGDDVVLLAGCDTPGVWPLACRLGERSEDDVIAEWTSAWADATGVSPTVSFVEGDGDAAADAYRALSRGRIGIADADVPLACLANSLVKLWARWLRQFANSGTPYLLEQFVQRRGRLLVEPDQLTMVMERKPLDLVLEMAGYDRDIESMPGLGIRRIRFRWES